MMDQSAGGKVEENIYRKAERNVHRNRYAKIKSVLFMTMVLALILPCISIGRTAAQEKQNSTASESSIESESQAKSENSTDDNTGRRIVRVAFPEQAGMSSIGHNGRVSGYNYDYLEKISEYTGWEMEYVAYPSADGNEAVGNAIQDLKDGNVDLLGPLLKTEQTMELFEYADNSYGTVYTTLCAPLSSTLREGGLRHGNLIKVGLWQQASTRNSEVLNFLDAENIQYEVTYYETQEKQQAALWNGDVDLISGLSLSPIANTRIVEKFAARPYYFAATKGNTALIEELDAAIAQISRLQPRLQDNLFEQYFLSADSIFTMTDVQEQTLAQLPTLQVLCVDSDAPYVYSMNGQAQGALILALNGFASSVGIKLEYTFCSGREEAEEMIKAGQYDLLVGMPFTSSFCSEKGFIKSESIFTSGLAYVRVAGKMEGGKIAIVSGLETIIDTSEFDDVVLFDNAKQCIKALSNGTVNAAAGDRSVMEYYIYETQSNVATSLISGNSQHVCIAVSRELSDTFLEVLNNYIYSLSDMAKTAYMDVGNKHDENQTVSRYIAHHPVQASIAVGTVTALAVAAILMVVYSAKMRRKNQQLRQANEAKTRFLSRMSHDIRTPLNGIVGLLKVNEGHFDDEELIKTNHEKIKIAAEHLLSLINDVLQMSKLEDNETTLKSEPFCLATLSQEVRTIIEERAVEKGITFHADHTECPVLWVYGSPLHLRQIFLNIYGNCIKYNKENGSIFTSLECLGTQNEMVTYRWTIRDTGIGMSEEFLKHIFDPFAQERVDARSVYMGTGLGMTIVKNLLDQMGGTIEITSKEGTGSQFIITIPFKKAKAPEEMPVENVSEYTEASVQGLHLMLVEDNELNAEIAQVLLSDEGAIVTTVGNGKQALDLFAHSAPHTFDAILMDIMMPVMDGLTATKKIRNVPHTDAKTIPIIAMTANAFEEDAKKCFDAGMNAHLTKPLQIEVVVGTIARLCKTKETAVSD